MSVCLPGNSGSIWASGSEKIHGSKIPTTAGRWGFQGLYRDYEAIGIIVRLCRGYIGIMAKNMETIELAVTNLEP